MISVATKINVWFSYDETKSTIPFLWLMRVGKICWLCDSYMMIYTCGSPIAPIWEFHVYWCPAFWDPLTDLSTAGTIIPTAVTMARFFLYSFQPQFQ